MGRLKDLRTYVDAELEALPPEKRARFDALCAEFGMEGV